MEISLAFMCNLLIVMTILITVTMGGRDATEFAESSSRPVFLRKPNHYSSSTFINHQMPQVFDVESQFWNEMEMVDSQVDSLTWSNTHLIDTLHRLERKFDRVLETVEFEGIVIRDMVTKLNLIDQYMRGSPSTNYMQGGRSTNYFQTDCVPSVDEMEQNNLMRELVAAVGYSNENLRKLVTNFDQVIESGSRSMQSLDKIAFTVQDINDRTIQIASSSSRPLQAVTLYSNYEEFIGSSKPLAVSTRINAESNENAINDRNKSFPTTPNYRSRAEVQTNTDQTKLNFESRGNAELNKNNNQLGIEIQPHYNFNQRSMVDYHNRKPVPESTRPNHEPTENAIPNRDSFQTATEEPKKNQNFGHVASTRPSSVSNYESSGKEKSDRNGHSDSSLNTESIFDLDVRNNFATTGTQTNYEPNKSLSDNAAANMEPSNRRNPIDSSLSTSTTINQKSSTDGVHNWNRTSPSTVDGKLKETTSVHHDQRRDNESNLNQVPNYESNGNSAPSLNQNSSTSTTLNKESKDNVERRKDSDGTGVLILERNQVPNTTVNNEMDFDIDVRNSFEPTESQTELKPTPRTGGNVIEVHNSFITSPKKFHGNNHNGFVVASTTTQVNYDESGKKPSESTSKDEVHNLSRALNENSSVHLDRRNDFVAQTNESTLANNTKPKEASTQPEQILPYEPSGNTVPSWSTNSSTILDKKWEGNEAIGHNRTDHNVTQIQNRNSNKNISDNLHPHTNFESKGFPTLYNNTNPVVASTSQNSSNLERSSHFNRTFQINSADAANKIGVPSQNSSGATAILNRSSNDVPTTATSKQVSEYGLIGNGSKIVTRKITTTTTKTTTNTNAKTTAKTQRTYSSVRKDMKRIKQEPNKRNCHDLTVKRNGIYKFGSMDELANDGDRFFSERYCDFYSSGSAWTVIQRRFADYNQESFNRSWLDYKLGFGSLDDEFWFGNDFIHQLTYDNEMELRIIIEDKDGKVNWVQYTQFKMKSENEGYGLIIGGYSGSVGDSLLYHNNQEFSTYDRRRNDNGQNCASTIGNGWWFKNCTEGVLGNWLGSSSTKMMVRPKSTK